MKGDVMGLMVKENKIEYWRCINMDKPTAHLMVGHPEHNTDTITCVCGAWFKKHDTPFNPDLPRMAARKEKE
jgi:hypothetical protein